MTMSSNDAPESLEAQAVRRRQKLLALKRKRDGRSDLEGNNSHQHEIGQDMLPKPIFRSYKPLDEALQDNVITDIRPEDIGQQVKDQLESAKSQIVMDQLDVTSLAPRKPDWDLKRDIAKKMEKLERQTQRAIAELIRDRLNERKEDLATLVNTGADTMDR